jgi:hypothetical protein
LKGAAGKGEGSRQARQPRRRADTDHGPGSGRRAQGGEADEIVVECGDQAIVAVEQDPARRRSRQRAGAEGDVFALGVQAEARALARQSRGVDRPQQDGEHERVAQLLLLARELELDIAVGGADDLHHRIAP